MVDKIPHDHAGQKDRTCKSCGVFKKAQEFPLSKSKWSYGGHHACLNCKVCEKERKLRSHLERTYGLTLEDYEGMVLEQGNKCYLCGEEPSDVYGRLVVDHCHHTGKVRKLLCRMCNIHLSKIEACPEYFNRVKDYLDSY
jgi:hypothetical protein